ncbi:hypothetical protein ACFWB2_32840 [Streptomyces virginiae]
MMPPLFTEVSGGQAMKEEVPRSFHFTAWTVMSGPPSSRVQMTAAL